MKAILVVAFALVGSALTLSPGMEYKYEYVGRLGMGIPEIRNKFAGVGIKTTVVVQVKTLENIVLQLTDIHVGEYVGDVICEVHSPLPIQYYPLTKDAKILEEPFSINLKNLKDNVMLVKETDKEWIVNIKKSIAQLFLIEPMRMNFGSVSSQNTISNVFHNQSTSFPKAFTLFEPSIFGTCSSDYALMLLDSKTTETIPEMDNVNKDPTENHLKTGETYLMTRTINFDKCSEKITFQNSGIEKMTDATKGLFENVISRSSVMKIMLVEENGYLKIQEGNIQGSLAVNPFGIKTEKLMSITNQTYILKSSAKITKEIMVPEPTKKIQTWFMEVASLYPAPTNPNGWVNYYNKEKSMYIPFMYENAVTGIDFSTNDLNKFKNALDKLMDETAVLMLSVGELNKEDINPWSTLEGKILTNLESVTNVIKAIDLENLKSLFEMYHSDTSDKGQMKLKLFIDVCSASGVGAPIKMLIDQIKNNKVTPERTASIFFTMTNNLMSVPMIPDVLALVKTFDFRKDPLLTATVWINVATTLNKVCLNKESSISNTPFVLYGKNVCDRKLVIDSFLPFLKHRLLAAEEPWQQVMITKAIANLAVPEVLPTLSLIISGNHDSEVKAMAIRSLTLEKFGEPLKDEVFNILMPIVTNTKEDSYLRQVAIATHLGWIPAPSWWQRLAALTWKEPSENVGSFIYYVMKHLAENTDPKYIHLSKVAQFVLPITKPYPLSMGKSLPYFFGKYDQKEFLATDFILTSLMDEENNLPREVFMHLENSFGGVRVPMLQTVLTSKMYPNSVSAVIEEVKKMMPDAWKNIVRAVRSMKKENLYSEIKKRIDQDYFSKDMHREGNLLMTLFGNMQYYVPINLQILLKNLDSNFFQSLISGKQMQMTKYLDPTPFEMFVPTELGIPLMLKMNAPTVVSGEGKTKLTVDGKEHPTIIDMFTSNHVNMEVATNFKFATKVLTTLKALLPWNKKLISSGVETMKSLSLPVKLGIKIGNQENLKNISLTITPMENKELPLVYAHTIPFVVRKSMWPGQLPKDFDDFKTITIEGGKKGSIKQLVTLNKEMTGLDASINWEGDISYPFNYGNILHIFGHPEMISKVIVSPTAKMFATTLSINIPTSVTKSLTTNIAFTNPFKVVDTSMKKQHTSMISDKTIKLADSILLDVNLLMEGTETRFFETNLDYKVLSKRNLITRSEMTIKTSRSALGSLDPNPEAFCLKVDATTPDITDLPTFVQQLKSSTLDYLFKGNLRGGKHCNDAQVATFKANIRLSDNKKNKLTENLVKNCEKIKDVEYDEATILVDYKEPLPQTVKNFTYQMYDILKGCSFPYIYPTYMNVKNPKGKISISANRNVADEGWKVLTALPTENIELDYFKISELIPFFNQFV